jgi:CheY-like chemotaxis protein
MLSMVSDYRRGSDPSSGPGASAERGADLIGVRVLVVEDEAMVAMLIEDILLDLGCVVLGPAPSVDAALKLLDEGTVDAAVLDINLSGEMVFPVADALEGQGVPFVFSTGYGMAGLEGRHLDRPVLQKPYQPARLRAALMTALGRS